MNNLGLSRGQKTEMLLFSDYGDNFEPDETF